jgi:hypothetical protein
VITGDIQQTAAESPMPTPVVILQPRTPAIAKGGPTSEQKPIHMMAGGEKFLPAPSDAGDCGMVCWVFGLKTTGCPVALEIIGADRVMRVFERNGSTTGEAYARRRQQINVRHRRRGITKCRPNVAITNQWCTQ